MKRIVLALGKRLFKRFGLVTAGTPAQKAVSLRCFWCQTFERLPKARYESQGSQLSKIQAGGQAAPLRLAASLSQQIALASDMLLQIKLFQVAHYLWGCEK